MIQGSLVALVTPMYPDGSLDMASLRALIDWHIDEGTDAIVAVGTTGESPTVNVEEHCEIIRVAVEHASGRIPIIAGTGGNSTTEAIELTRFAANAGAAASLSVVPYYNKPTQEGLYRHFKSICEAVDLPLILYNVPSRTVADLDNETVLRLAELPGIAGLKDATSDLVRHVALQMRLSPGKQFGLYSGNDDTALAYMLLGGHGVISVTANVAPALMSALCAAALDGNLAMGRELNTLLMPLHTGLFVEANPVPVKWALSDMGRIESGIRLPLVPLSESLHETVRAACRTALRSTSRNIRFAGVTDRD